MTIDVNELREAIQTFGSQAINEGDLNELLDRLEAAEEERDALRAKVEAMENQEPVAQVAVHKTGGNAGIAWSARPLNEFDSLPLLREGDRLYLAPGAQPAPGIPESWLRAIDEALVVAHIGVANASDTYEQAREKLNNLIGFHVDVATDPAVNGGWKLVPIEPTPEMREAGVFAGGIYYDVVEAAYEAMLEAAPEVKP